MTVVPVILGTDENSYTQARAYHEAFGRKAIVCGAGVLLPFFHSKIADIHTAPNFSTDPQVCADLLNKVWAQRDADVSKFMIIVPTEEYLHTLYRALPLLEFEPFLPYPEPKLGRALMDKSYFYQRMNDLGVAVPQTLVAQPNHIADRILPGEQFIKADDYETFNEFEFPEKHKGFHAKTQEEAQAYLEAVYASGFAGNMLVQTFIAGDHRQEFSVNGYRARDGRMILVQARSVLTDTRPMWVGNHLLLTDTDRADLAPLCEQAVAGLDYTGFFNIDFKVDAHTDIPYMLELNTRLGRSSYYALLNGLNFMECAIADVLGKPFPQVERQPFSWITATRAQVAQQLSGEELAYFMEKERYQRTGNALAYKFDDDSERWERIMRMRNGIGSQLGW